MKILKKFLLIFYLSIFLLSFNEVKANTIIDYTTSSNSYIETYLNNHPNNNVDDFKNMLLEGLDIDAEIENKKFFIILDGSIQNRVFVRIFDDNVPVEIRTETYNANKFLHLTWNGSYKYINFNIYFKNNGEFDSIGYRDSGTSNGFDLLTVINNANNNYSSYILDTNFENFPYNYNYNNTNADFSVDNVELYEFNSNVPINFLNGNRYNFTIGEVNYEPIIYLPQISHYNGYDEVTFLIDNFTPQSNEEGYNILIIDNTTGNIENIPPDVTNINQTIIKKYYENTNISFQVVDREYLILQEYQINTDIIYENNTNYSIRINSVSNEQRIVYYDYLIENNNNVRCYYSINSGNFVEDTNCTDKTYTYFLQLNDNGNITWEIRDLENNILYNYSQNFVFNVSNPFINFKDNYNNDFLNLDVLINRYENNDVIEYSINNSQFMQVNYLEDYSISQNIKYFTINNLNDNDLILVRVKRNNSVITTAKYRANYLKYSNNSNENFNISNIFNKININNINEELKNYIKNFGNLILNSKIGNLLLLQTFCLVITIIIKMIRN